ncbi:hypothetical protein VE01_10604 [Pseudogymnoascus verrucosus]|uniref:Uncharacterized protein n=1 Tax=Pseudogymnoascus verrucosus TaxID=342668 RepID=A0A1B8G6F8_9PEZI|nr:uncharacterized protein VE01_10604 [Pseudogymnoascus verrucosus]OBT91411.1 hypothetical protein VE01_10604 [Pseudogymnoascus verrucosus]
MKLSSALAFLLPVVALANPLPASDAIADGENAGLVSRSKQVCKIVNASVVNCRYDPWVPNNALDRIRTTFKKGTGHDFTCYTEGECINGNCTWDWAVNWGCYVPGAYTDANCSKAKLGHC